MGAENRPDMDIREHERAFNALVKGIAIVIGAIALVLILLALTQL